MKWPRKYTDFLAIGFFLICIVTIFFFELLVVLPYYQDDCSLAPLHLFAAFYLVFNILTNIYFLYATDTSTLKILMPSSLLPGWHYCCLCEANSPPRAYHCTICDRCILRRDHHCPFSACCIGYKNYKYYMGLLFNVSISSLYASIFHLQFIWSNMDGFNPLTFFSHLMPIPFMMFRIINTWTMFCNLISMLCIIGFLFAGGLFLFHFILLANNQTSFERSHKICDYDLKNWNLNLTESLGSKWPVTVFLSPLVESKLPRDGTHFPIRNEHKNL